MPEDRSEIWSDQTDEREQGTPVAPAVPSTADAAREVDEREVTKALNAIVYESISPILVGLSVLYLVQMVTHMLLLSHPNAVYISLMSAGSSVVLLLLRIVMTGLDRTSNKIYLLSSAAAVIALGNTLWSQALTEDVEVVVMALLLVAIGFVFLSTLWFIGVLALSLISWLVVTALVHQAPAFFFPTIGILGAASLAIMIHIIRRGTNRRAERLRRATEQQQEALARALMVKEHHRRSLEESEQSLQEALEDLQTTKRALERRERELSRTVDELTVAKEKAEEASQLKSAMLANMSHEVRTPLTSITGFAELLREEASGQAHDFARMIHDNSKRLLETLGSVLRLSKLEAGKQTLKREEVDLIGETDALVAEQEERAREAGVDLRLDSDHDHCTCLLDRGAVQRILRNLVGNAIKFTEPGGEVVIRVEKVSYSATAATNGTPFSHARLEIQDTGIGMSQSFLEDMFQAFRQESEGPRRTHEGSGLGLSITKQLVELLQGEIEVESEKGVGTLFTIHLPRTPEEDQIPEDAKSEPVLQKA